MAMRRSVAQSVSASAPDPEAFGEQVLGPIVAQFCLRLWSVGHFLDDRGDAALLFCARGGLRMRQAFDHFLAATGLPLPVHTAPLMVSRLVALRASLARVVDEELPALLPSATAAVGYEFANRSARAAAGSIAGVPLASDDQRWDGPATPQRLRELLGHADGAATSAAIVRQDALFRSHLDDALAGRHVALLVDTGLFGTTRLLLAEARADLDVASVLLGRSFRPGYPVSGARTTGLLVESNEYLPWRRPTSLLRHWHFVEWLFEPELPSVRTFRSVGGEVRSDLEVPGWAAAIDPRPGSAYAGVVRYLNGLGPAPAVRIVPEAEAAWTRLHRAIVWPSPADATNLAVTTRTHDFGRAESWGAPSWQGPLAALRTSQMWREGMIAGARTRWRVPLLGAVQAGYVARHVARRVRAARGGRAG